MVRQQNVNSFNDEIINDIIDKYNNKIHYKFFKMIILFTKQIYYDEIIITKIYWIIHY
jgi:hypothetical protein